MDLQNRVVLITGAKRIGDAVARAVAARGADVAIAYRRSKSEADATAAAVQAAGRRALIVQADVSDPTACVSILDAVGKHFNRLDVLVNMASVYQAAPIGELDAATWRRHLGVDLDGTFFCSIAALPLLRKAGGGRIINFSDWLPTSARPRYKGYTTYYVAKAAVKALTEALALEVAGDGILVNAIAPGPILAPPDTSAQEHEAVERNTPLGRWGGPDAIVTAVLALIESDFITGETIRVDGGRHLY
ncbi:MAG TPA: SDR family oxidoreductase [Vicinamibacterales bacterium]|nr:SDR family oxidoreductase [Vicinamibacterales bacterium]